MFTTPMDTLALTGLCVLLASYVQNLSGFAFGLVFLGLISAWHLMPIAEAANAVTLITLVQVTYYFRGQSPQKAWVTMRPALPTSFLGIALGVWLLTWMSGNALNQLRAVLGVTIILSALLLVTSSAHAARRSGTAAFALTGLASGLMGGLFSTAGPPLVYLMYRQALPGEVIRQCLLLSFALGQGCRLVMVLAMGQFTPHAVLIAAIAAPIVMAVVSLHRRYPPKLSHLAINRLTALLLLLTGLSLLRSVL